MGYYVELSSSDLRILPEQKDAIFKVWCAFNDAKNDHLKSGGSWSAGKQDKKWFSWMTEDYDKTSTCIEDILDMLGFDYAKDDDGTLSNFSYDSKVGAEALFFNEAAPFLNIAIMSWKGEDGARFHWAFDGSSLTEFSSKKEAADHLSLAKKALKEKDKLEKIIPKMAPGSTNKV